MNQRKAADVEGWKATLIRLGQAALFATAIFSVATAFDQWHRYLELFSHFRLQYLGASLLLTLAFLLLRRHRYSLLGVAAVAVNASLVLPWYLPDAFAARADSDPAPVVGDAVKLLQANVLRSNRRAGPLLALIRDEQPDILVIIEATPAWIAALEPIESAYPYRIAEARDDAFGMALYSRLPLDATAVVESSALGHPDIVATATVGRARLRLIATHPVPPMGFANFRARNRALDDIARLAARTPTPLVVLGDLNIGLWAAHYRRFEEVSGLTNARRGFGIVPTWPVFLPPAMIPIDHALVSADLHVVDFRSGPDIGSDHLPIIVSVAVPGSG